MNYFDRVACAVCGGPFNPPPRLRPPNEIPLADIPDGNERFIINYKYEDRYVLQTHNELAIDGSLVSIKDLCWLIDGHVLIKRPEGMKAQFRFEKDGLPRTDDYFLTTKLWMKCHTQPYSLGQYIDRDQFKDVFDPRDTWIETWTKEQELCQFPPTHIDDTRPFVAYQGRAIPMHAACFDILLGALKGIAHNRGYDSMVGAQACFELLNDHVRLDGQMRNPGCYLDYGFNMDDMWSNDTWDAWSGYEFLSVDPLLPVDRTFLLDLLSVDDLDLPKFFNFGTRTDTVLAPIERLPAEIISQIMSYLNLGTVTNLRQASRPISTVRLSNRFWRENYEISFDYLWKIGFCDTNSNIGTGDVDWRRIYAQSRALLRRTGGVFYTPNLGLRNGLRIHAIASSLAKDLWKRELQLRQKTV